MRTLTTLGNIQGRHLIIVDQLCDGPRIRVKGCWLSAYKGHYTWVNPAFVWHRLPQNHERYAQKVFPSPVLEQTLTTQFILYFFSCSCNLFLFDLFSIE